MTLHIDRSNENLRAAAVILLAALVSACTQTTRGNTATSSSSSTNMPTTSSASMASREQSQGMLVRISEIGIDPNQLEEYKAILKEEAEASVRLEPGVISIFPMFRKDNPT